MTYPKRPAKPREAAVLAQCLHLLKLRGLLYWRNNTGMLRTGNGQEARYVRFGAVGSSDILAVLPRHSRRPGVLLAIEVKRPGGQPTSAQWRFLHNVRDSGGEILVVDDVVQLEAFLTDLGA